MKPDSSPLVSKLTLLVLVLILACLMLLVLRSYSAKNPRATDVITAVVPPESEESGRDLIVTPPRAPTIRRTVPLPTPSPGPADSASNLQHNNAPADTPASRQSNVTGRLSFGAHDESPTTLVETLAANGSALLAGTVTLEGTPKPEIQIDLGAICGALHSRPVTTRHFVVGPRGEFANVVVYITSGLQRKFGPVRPGPLIDQVGCMFEPYISAVVAGQTFQIRNSDPTLHNIHFNPKVTGNREFNAGQGVQGQVNTFSIPVPEMNMRLKCDVHPWMFTYISVFEHPYFAVTDTNGFFQLPAQIPAGDYVIGASHLKLGTELTQEISLHEGEQRSLHFQFTVPSGAIPQGGVVRSN